MHVLRIEHPVREFEGWKQAFDSDPVNREQSGVRTYRILRPVDDSRYVMIDLELDSEREAEAMLESLRELWSRVDGTVIERPQARIVEVVETKSY